MQALAPSLLYLNHHQPPRHASRRGTPAAQAAPAAGAGAMVLPSLLRRARLRAGRRHTPRGAAVAGGPGPALWAQQRGRGRLAPGTAAGERGVHVSDTSCSLYLLSSDFFSSLIVQLSPPDINCRESPWTGPAKCLISPHLEFTGLCPGWLCWLQSSAARGNLSGDCSTNTKQTVDRAPPHI